MRSRSNWNLKLKVFKERGKTEYTEKNLSDTQPTTWRRRQDSNPSHIGGRLVLSPMRHPLLPNERRCGSITRSVTSSATTTKTNTRTAKTRTTKTQRPFRVCKSSLTLFTPRFNYLYTIVVVCGWLPVVTNQVKPLKQYYCTDDC